MPVTLRSAAQEIQRCTICGAQQRQSEQSATSQKVLPRGKILESLQNEPLQARFWSDEFQSQERHQLRDVLAQNRVRLVFKADCGSSSIKRQHPAVQRFEEHKPSLNEPGE